MELLRVHYSLNGRGYLREFIRRVERFCEKYESESDLDVLFESITESYYSDRPGIICYLGVENGISVAHSMISLEQFFGHHYINMLQYWRDPSVKVPYKIKEMVFREIIKWGREMGIDDMRIWARNEEVAQLFENVYGFERSEHIIMNASLEKVADRIAELPLPEEKEKTWEVAETPDQAQPPT
jgi:hypothetical protein